MTGGTAPAGLAVLALVFVLVVLLVRWVATPVTVRGRHRAPWWLLRPSEVTRRCPAEDRNTVHARTPWRGELVCRSCSHIRGGTR
jgi:hypothetical protein